MTSEFFIHLSILGIVAILAWTWGRFLYDCFWGSRLKKDLVQAVEHEMEGLDLDGLINAPYKHRYMIYLGQYKGRPIYVFYESDIDIKDNCPDEFFYRMPVLTHPRQ